jgi:hypothetical protein
MRNLSQRLERLEARINRAGEAESPSDIKERILASLRGGVEPNRGSFRTDSPNNGGRTDQPSLREIVLKGLREEGYITADDATR